MTMILNKMVLPIAPPPGRAVYCIFDPVIDLLLKNGNELRDQFRWGANQTGFTCVLKRPINFDLIDSTFILPPNVAIDRERNIIDYQMGEVSIFSI